MDAVTEMLDRMADGDEDARREVLRVLYDPMRRIARALLKGERRDISLHTTELLHETLASMLAGGFPRATGKDHFLSITARAMWRKLVERARRRTTRWRYVNSFIEESHDGGLAPELALAIRCEMRALRKYDPCAAQIVHCKIVEHKTWEETADAVGVPYNTAREDYAFAITWLRNRLQH